MLDSADHNPVPDRRFAFGSNWARFLSLLSEERIVRAEDSLREMLETDSLAGKTFLDIGSGSGLFSLAARRLGARVRSFDYDENSVACTEELRRQYFPDDPDWLVERGSILDEDYVRSLGSHDVVYSWGVLHHTGRMWQALGLASVPVAEGGKLFVAIYNLQSPLRHRLTLAMKRTYVRIGGAGRNILLGAYYVYATGLEMMAALFHGRPLLERVRNYGDSSRGMSWWHDTVDWVGGYPYEAAKPEEIFDFFRLRGFRLNRLQTDSGRGCNQFVFARDGAIEVAPVAVSG